MPLLVGRTARSAFWNLFCRPQHVQYDHPHGCLRVPLATRDRQISKSDKPEDVENSVLHASLPYSHNQPLRPSQPFRNTAVVGACASSAPAKTVALVAALRCCSFRRAGTILWPLDRLALAIHVRPIIRAAYLVLILLLTWLCLAGR
jgi:hypothetical protein